MHSAKFTGMTAEHRTSGNLTYILIATGLTHRVQWHHKHLSYLWSQYDIHVVGQCGICVM